jgi:hypothetical protein
MEKIEAYELITVDDSDGDDYDEDYNNNNVNDYNNNNINKPKSKQCCRHCR